MIEETVRQIRGSRGAAEKQFVSASGTRYKTDVVFYKIAYDVQNGLAQKLGCQLDEGYVRTDEKQQTTVKDVYAAGDIDLDRHYIVLAAAAGARAAISIYEELLKEISRGHKSR